MLLICYSFVKFTSSINYFCCMSCAYRKQCQDRLVFICKGYLFSVIISFFVAYPLSVHTAGSVANRVFHQILFESSLGLIQKCWPNDLSGKKRKKDPPSNSQAKAKGRKRAKNDKEASVDGCINSVYHIVSQKWVGVFFDVKNLSNTNC